MISDKYSMRNGKVKDERRETLRWMMVDGRWLME
jgi:hypothetical protein